MNDVFDDTLGVTVSFGIIDGPEPGGALPVLLVGCEHRSGALSLSTNYTTHCVIWVSFGTKSKKYVFLARNEMEKEVRQLN